MSEDVDLVKARGEVAGASRRATQDLFQAKKPREQEETLTIDGEQVTVLLRAIGRKKYDALITECPPSTAQRAKGESYDQEKFAPKLVSRVMVDPQMSEVDWRNIWNDDNWNRAELGDIFIACVNVCSAGVNVDPFVSV